MRGCVTKKNGRFYIVYYIGKDENGKWKQKWEGGYVTKKEAEKILRSRIDELENSFVKKADNSTVEVYLKQWLDTYCVKRLALNTINGYKNNISKHIIPYIGKITLNRLDPKDIQKMYSKLSEKGLSGTSMLYIHRTLHKALATAVKTRLLMNNVLDFVDSPAKSNFKSNVLSADQIDVLIRACKGTEIYVPVLLAVLLGLRRGEALGLQWNDIDLQHKTISINRTATFYKQSFVLSDAKTKNSRRTLILADSLFQIIEDHKIAQNEQAYTFGEGFNPYKLINCRADGMPLSSATLNHQYKDILKANKLPDIRFHDLRHTNATLMLKNAIPAKIVSSMLGHSTVAITLDTYSHVLTDMQQDAVNIVENILYKSTYTK